jgi:putative hemolysin
MASALAACMGLLALGGCAMSAGTTTTATSASVPHSVPSSPATHGPLGLANPAAVACSRAGGVHRVVRQADGGEAGLCHLPSGATCEAWAFFRGQCPVQERARD